MGGLLDLLRRLFFGDPNDDALVEETVAEVRSFGARVGDVFDAVQLLVEELEDEEEAEALVDIANRYCQGEDPSTVVPALADAVAHRYPGGFDSAPAPQPARGTAATETAGTDERPADAQPESPVEQETPDPDTADDAAPEPEVDAGGEEPPPAHDDTRDTYEPPADAVEPPFGDDELAEDVTPPSVPGDVAEEPGVESAYEDAQDEPPVEETDGDAQDEPPVEEADGDAEEEAPVEEPYEEAQDEAPVEPPEVDEPMAEPPPEPGEPSGADAEQEVAAAGEVRVVRADGQLYAELPNGSVPAEEVEPGVYAFDTPVTNGSIPVHLTVGRTYVMLADLDGNPVQLDVSLIELASPDAYGVTFGYQESVEFLQAVDGQPGLGDTRILFDDGTPYRAIEHDDHVVYQELGSTSGYLEMDGQRIPVTVTGPERYVIDPGGTSDGAVNIAVVDGELVLATSDGLPTDTEVRWTGDRVVALVDGEEVPAEDVVADPMTYEIADGELIVHLPAGADLGRESFTFPIEDGELSGHPGLSVAVDDDGALVHAESGHRITWHPPELEAQRDGSSITTEHLRFVLHHPGPPEATELVSRPGDPLTLEVNGDSYDVHVDEDGAILHDLRAGASIEVGLHDGQPVMALGTEWFRMRQDPNGEPREYLVEVPGAEAEFEVRTIGTDAVMEVAGTWYSIERDGYPTDGARLTWLRSDGEGMRFRPVDDGGLAVVLGGEEVVVPVDYGPDEIRLAGTDYEIDLRSHEEFALLRPAAPGGTAEGELPGYELRSDGDSLYIEVEDPQGDWRLDVGDGGLSILTDEGPVPVVYHEWEPSNGVGPPDPPVGFDLGDGAVAPLRLIGEELRVALPGDTGSWYPADLEDGELAAEIAFAGTEQTVDVGFDAEIGTYITGPGLDGTPEPWPVTIGDTGEVELPGIPDIPEGLQLAVVDGNVRVEWVEGQTIELRHGDGTYFGVWPLDPEAGVELLIRPSLEGTGTSYLAFEDEPLLPVMIDGMGLAGAQAFDVAHEGTTYTLVYEDGRLFRQNADGAAGQEVFWEGGDLVVQGLDGLVPMESFEAAPVEVPGGTVQVVETTDGHHLVLPDGTVPAVLEDGEVLVDGLRVEMRQASIGEGGSLQPVVVAEVDGADVRLGLTTTGLSLYGAEDDFSVTRTPDGRYVALGLELRSDGDESYLMSADGDRHYYDGLEDVGSAGGLQLLRFNGVVQAATGDGHLLSAEPAFGGGYSVQVAKVDGGYVDVHLGPDGPATMELGGEAVAVAVDDGVVHLDGSPLLGVSPSGDTAYVRATIDGVDLELERHSPTSYRYGSSEAPGDQVPLDRASDGSWSAWGHEVENRDELVLVAPNGETIGPLERLTRLDDVAGHELYRIWSGEHVAVIDGDPVDVQYTGLEYRTTLPAEDGGSVEIVLDDEGLHAVLGGDDEAVTLEDGVVVEATDAPETEEDAPGETAEPAPAPPAADGEGEAEDPIFAQGEAAVQGEGDGEAQDPLFAQGPTAVQEEDDGETEAAPVDDDAPTPAATNGPLVDPLSEPDDDLLTPREPEPEPDSTTVLPPDDATDEMESQEPDPIDFDDEAVVE